MASAANAQRVWLQANPSSIERSRFAAGLNRSSITFEVGGVVLARVLRLAAVLDTQP